MSEQSDLIARLKAVEGPSREMDAEISMVTLFPHIECTLNPKVPGSYIHPVLGTVYSEKHTASLDAALTLVPEEFTAWEVRSRQKKKRFVAEVSRLVQIDGYEEEQLKTGRARHHALALCIAALRARAALAEEE